MNQTEEVPVSQIWASLSINTVKNYNPVNEIGIMTHTTIKADEEWDIYIVSKYLLTKYLLITKGILLQWKSLADNTFRGQS